MKIGANPLRHHGRRDVFHRRNQPGSLSDVAGQAVESIAKSPAGRRVEVAAWGSVAPQRASEPGRRSAWRRNDSEKSTLCIPPTAPTSRLSPPAMTRRRAEAIWPVMLGSIKLKPGPDKASCNVVIDIKASRLLRRAQAWAASTTIGEKPSFTNLDLRPSPPR